MAPIFKPKTVTRRSVWCRREPLFPFVDLSSSGVARLAIMEQDEARRAKVLAAKKKVGV
jgi:hypothetical protein